MGRFANIDTRDPAVNITTWFLVVVAALSVLIRLGTKYWLFRRLTSDDYLIIASLLLCLVQSTVISRAVAYGYGDHFSTVSSVNFTQIIKYQYAASILYIISLSLSKLSLSTFISNVSPVRRDHQLATIMQAAMVVVGITGVFGTAFQCRLPRPWDYWRQKCTDLSAWADFLSAANIATDVAIVMQALVVVFSIQATWKRKLVFASVFLSRVFVIIFLIAELILSDPYSRNPTYAPCHAQIASQLVQSASILTACWGQVKPFLNKLKSNGLRIQGVEYQSSAGTGGKGYGSASRSSRRSGGQPQGRGQGVRGEELYQLVPVTVGQTETTVSVEPTLVQPQPQWWDADTDADGERQSYSSRVGIIHETRTWGMESM
ncbi:hypothetical protein BJY04DRAFT_224192 [Aspergillus karnatakaensis]|uniref:uncharacterized protein n=1 Tax=Aspergillus karnatakaensis TaxID=1810916 RepID=UPI003CCD9AB7